MGTAPKPAAKRAVSVLIKRMLTESSDPAAFFCVTQVNVASFAVLLSLLKQQLSGRTFLALQPIACAQLTRGGHTGEGITLPP